MTKFVITVLFTSVLTVPAFAQTAMKQAATPGSILMIVPGEHYKAGMLHRLLLGEKHRDLWALPLQAEVLDLSKFAGGLTPLKRGGGGQTRSLRLRGADGKTYVFRSLEKDPSVNLSPELRESIAARLLQDQISALLPFAALAVEPFLQAADVLHASPRVAIMPDDARLGEYRAEFGATLGLIEERPEAADGVGFAGAAEVVSSDKMIERIEENPGERVAARDYLTARLLDLFIGDFDRHPDQWRWAGFAEADGMIWRPIPRDRDFAFTHLDGLVLLLAPYRYPQLVDFESEYPSIFRLTWSGRALDRRLLAELDRPTWDSIATALQARLTDARIDAAVARLPETYEQRIGANLRDKLRSRRDRLPAAAAEFFALLAGWVDVHATDGADSAKVTHRADAGADLEIVTRDGGTSRNTFRRTFTAQETRELRVFLHGGNDVLVIQDAPGSKPGMGIPVRVVGGGGDDRLIDGSRNAVSTKFYDDRGKNQFEGGASTRVDTREYRAPPPVAHAAQPRDWGSSWLSSPLVSYSSDFGVLAGASITRLGFGFRKYPYASKLVLSAGYATVPGRFKAEALFDRITANPQIGVHATLRASGIEARRFYGYGNDTDATLADGAYKLPRSEYLAHTALVLKPSAQLSFSVGPQLKVIDTRAEAGSFFEETDEYGSGRFAEAGMIGNLRFDSRDQARAATKGVLLSAAGSFYPAALDVTTSFGSTRLEGATYLTAGDAFATLALRGMAHRVWGRTPFHEAAYLGGSETLRGFREQRFAGDAAVLGNAELRIKLAHLFLFLPEQFGVHGLADVGRVYVDGESPGGWHSAVGGGFWLSIIDRSLLASVSFARSNERTGLYVKGGFQF